MFCPECGKVLTCDSCRDGRRPNVDAVSAPHLPEAGDPFQLQQATQILRDMRRARILRQRIDDGEYVITPEMDRVVADRIWRRLNGG